MRLHAETDDFYERLVALFARVFVGLEELDLRAIRVIELDTTEGWYEVPACYTDETATALRAIRPDETVPVHLTFDPETHEELTVTIRPDKPVTVGMWSEHFVKCQQVLGEDHPLLAEVRDLGFYPL